MTMYTSLKPEYYYSQEIYLKEIEKIFSNLWIFAGMRSLVPKNDSFFTRKIIEIPIFIQNTNGEINAFINQCPHRLSPIHTQQFGTKKITCPFHGWSFNKNGCIHAIPNEELYNFSPAQKDNLKLKKIELKSIGEFLFVNFNPNPIPIETQFKNDILNQLADYSKYFDTQIGYANFAIKTNWKLNTEVIKDPNHIPFVHAKSFKPWLINNKQELSNNKTAEEWLEISKVSIDNLSYTSRAEIFDSLPWYRSLITRYSDNNDHISWYLYPNTHFASVRNDYFFIQQYDPASKDTINFNLIVFTSKKKNSSTDFTALLRALIIEERKIIEEDSIVLGQLQASLGSWSPDPVHGAYEYHISQQNKWYLDNVINN